MPNKIIDITRLVERVQMILEGIGVLAILYLSAAIAGSILLFLWRLIS